MKSHLDLEEVLSNTGPIEDYLHLLATERELPRVAIALCTVRIGEAGPKLRATLEKAANGEVLSDAEMMLVFRGLYILGAGRDSQTFPLLLGLLRRPNKEVEDLLGDAITEGLARIAAGVFDGDAEALFAAIADRSIDEFIREALLGAATFLCWEGLIERDRMLVFLERFHEERLAVDEDQAWIGWLEAIAHLGLRTLAPRVDSAWSQGRIPMGVLNRSHFEEDLAEAERAPGDIDRFKRANLGYIDDVIEAMEWTDWRPAGDKENFEPDWTQKALLDENAPVTNPWRHIGRNDPCPCGSGKKAKKCCLPH
ncbi:MAG: DUF1186 domain-containing protein [Rhodomicrobium sp.]